MWWWVLWHLWHEYEHITVSFSDGAGSKFLIILYFRVNLSIQILLNGQTLSWVFQQIVPMSKNLKYTSRDNVKIL